MIVSTRQRRNSSELFFFDLQERAGKGGECFCAILSSKIVRGDDVIPGVFGVFACFKGKFLTFKEVELLFHEIGHTVHWLCLEVEWEALASVEQDFLECPSQMLEWWLYDCDVLRFLSDSKISEETATKLRLEKVSFSAYTAMRNLAQVVFDFRVHSASTCPDFELLWVSSFRDVLQVDMTEMKGGFCSFIHMFGPYAGVFYSYLYSQVFASVVFVFLKENSNSLLSCGNVGMRYREVVLSQGRKRASIESLRILLGVEPCLEDFARMNGWFPEAFASRLSVATL